MTSAANETSRAETMSGKQGGQLSLDLIQLCAKMGWPFYEQKPLAWRAEQVAAIHDAAAPVAARSSLRPTTELPASP